MLFTRSLLSISTVATCLIISVVKAAPVSSYSSDIYVPEQGFLLTESLSEYYENIVDQVMLDVSEQILTFIPESISHGDVEARQLAQKSLNRNLNFMRASLLASVNPLVSTDIPQIAGFSLIEQQNEKTEEIENSLSESITTLNKKISHQLGLIVNAQQSSSILIRQASTFTPKRLSNSPTVVTVEWKLRQPFQINLIREEQQTQKDVLLESEWLLHQLSLIEVNLLNEFNDRTQEATQLVMESLSLDI